MKRLSVIIVTYNSEKDIYDCLDSIKLHSDINADELENIVVDNNSRQTDTMFSEIRNRFGDGIILLKNACNGGYGQGNNMGIRRASAPVILIMNPDVRLMEPVFQTVLHAFDDDSRLGMYGMKQMLSPIEPSTNSFSCTSMMNGYLATVLTALCNRTGHYLPPLHVPLRFLFLHPQADVRRSRTLRRRHFHVRRRRRHTPPDAEALRLPHGLQPKPALHSSLERTSARPRIRKESLQLRLYDAPKERIPQGILHQQPPAEH